jgi:hypothetical protein
VDPLTTAFGRYKYGVFRTYVHMFKGLFKGTKEERLEALSQVVMLGLVTAVVGPYMNSVVEQVTGHKGAELRPRGASAIPYELGRIVTGKSNIESALSRTWTPSPLIGNVPALLNKQFTGRPIIPPMNWQKRPGQSVATAAGNIAEFAGQQVMPPYKTYSTAMVRKETRRKPLLHRVAKGTEEFAWEQVGVKLPSQAARKYQATSARRVEQARRQQLSKPMGVIPDITNRLFR